MSELRVRRGHAGGEDNEDGREKMRYNGPANKYRKAFLKSHPDIHPSPFRVTFIISCIFQNIWAIKQILIFVTMQCDTTNPKPLSLAHALENLVHLASVDTKSLQLGVSFLCHHF